MSTAKKSAGKLISIVIATFNCGRKIEDTLNSIFSQNEELFEVIILDAVSTDETLEVIRKFQNRLTLVSEKDEGVYDAFNKGIERANGKYIYFIGAGDCLQPDILDQIKDQLPPEIPTLFYGNCYFVARQEFNGKKFKPSDFIFNNICHQGMFFHREIFNFVGRYDLRYRIFSDWLTNLKIFLDERITINYLPLYIADFEGNGMSAEIKNDPPFRKDYPRIVTEKLGWRAGFICRLFMANPPVFVFFFSHGYRMLGQFVTIARPSVHAYRRMKVKLTGKRR